MQRFNVVTPKRPMLSNPAAAQGSSKLPLLVLGAAGIPLALVGAVLFFFDPCRYHIYPTCLFHETTGLLCAGCGSTRALHELLHGHLATAFRFNPLLIASLPFLVWIGARQTIRKARNQPAALYIKPKWLWLVLGVLIAFTIVRNIPAMPFASLPQ